MGGNSNIFHDDILIDISMPDIYCLLVDIGRRQKKWHPTIFEFEGDCHLQGLWKTDVWWFVIHVNIFRGFEEWPFDEIIRRFFIGLKMFFWSESWYFHVEGDEYFCVVSCGFIKFYISCCFKLWFFWCNLSAYFISGAHFLKSFIKRCFKVIECLIVGIYFW